uniref:Uncharacterized protein n=1 Tax=Rhizophora mucronata TaxID=61149 RepID=A0A2P2PPS2_RHIMU
MLLGKDLKQKASRKNKTKTQRNTIEKKRAQIQHQKHETRDKTVGAFEHQFNN